VTNHIEGVTGDQAIANKFADYFAACCGNADMHRSTLCEKSCEQYDFSDGLLSVEDVDTILRSNVKLGKAPGIDHLTAEHILYSHPAVVLHLTKLLNAIILHSYVPDSFGFSITVPPVKDRCGDISKLANYRAISLSPVPAKLFESCLSN